LPLNFIDGVAAVPVAKVAAPAKFDVPVTFNGPARFTPLAVVN
jgi:hypothetical protein